MTTQQPPQYQPQYQQQPPYHPPPRPVKRSGGCMKLVAIGAVVFLGLIVVTCYFAGKRAEEAREQERIATEQADTAILASIEKAKALYAEGKLEEAVRELEGAAGNVSGSNDVRMQAHRLLDEYGKEYGVKFEAEVAALLDKANKAITGGNADEAEKHLKAAVELRYAPNVEDARKLLATLREARSDEKMKSFVVAMSEAEFEVFLNDLTLPDRAAFERPEIDAIFKAALKLNHDKAQKWRGEAEAAKEVERKAADKRREAEVKKGNFGTKDDVLEYAPYLRETSEPVEFVTNGTRVYHWPNLSAEDIGLKNRSWLKLYDEKDDGTIQGFLMFVDPSSGNVAIATSLVLFSQLVCRVGGLEREAQTRISGEIQEWIVASGKKATKDVMTKEYGWVKVGFMWVNDGGNVGVMLQVGTRGTAE